MKEDKILEIAEVFEVFVTRLEASPNNFDNVENIATKLTEIYFKEELNYISLAENLAHELCLAAKELFDSKTLRVDMSGTLESN